MEGVRAVGALIFGTRRRVSLQMNEIESGRQHPAHVSPVERHNEPVIIFLTVCSKDRKRIFASADVAQLIVGAWLGARSWLVGRYVIMPDHIHLFCAPGTFPPEPLKQWIRYWKAVASKNWPCPNEHPIWQRDFWDTQLRRHENYDQKWDYVNENPVRAGLVSSSEKWPFHGELNILRW
jgi:putative transposase